MSIDRRNFVKLTAGMLTAAALPGCASVAVTRIMPSGGAVRLPLRNFPRLAQAGGYLKLQPDGAATPLYVLALDGGEYAALSPVCTHLGCTVNIEGARLVCPCHGSTYDREGSVLRGPAERPLQRFPATVTPGGELVIRLQGER
ncbi:MAG: ubiquinol-cytochrome c reductase iron-sulfur subunit [Longimicrobiaceae bacterium]